MPALAPPRAHLTRLGDAVGVIANVLCRRHLLCLPLHDVPYRQGPGLKLLPSRSQCRARRRGDTPAVFGRVVALDAAGGFQWFVLNPSLPPNPLVVLPTRPLLFPLWNPFPDLDASDATVRDRGSTPLALLPLLLSSRALTNMSCTMTSLTPFSGV